MIKPNSNNQTHKASLPHILSLIFLCFLALSSVYPPIRALTNYREIWLIGVLSWYILNLFEAPKFFLRPSLYNYSIYIFIIYTVTTSYIFDNPQIGNRFFEISQVFLFYLAYSKNSYLNRPKDNLIIIKILSPIIIYTSLVTIFAYRFNPHISRGTIIETTEVNQVLLLGIGDYAFIYFLLIYFAILFNIFYYRRYLTNSKLLLPLFLICLIFGINIVLSNYAIAFILFVFSVIMILVIRKLNFIWITIYTIIFILIYIFSLQYISNLLDFLAYIFGDMLNSSRMSEINDLISRNEEGASIEARFITYNISINTFFENPLFGIINNKNLYQEYRMLSFGQHSQILDCFALFGFIIGSLQLYLFLNPFIIRMRNKNRILRKLTFIVLIIFFLLITFNNITPSVGFATFFIFPSIYDWMATKLKSMR